MEKVKIERYEKLVKQYCEQDTKYIDPDFRFEENVKMFSEETHQEITISMSTDGLCGISKLEKMGYKEERLKKEYKKVREGLAGCLVWPSYAMSINQVRGFVNTFDDRIDLLFMDLQKFYGLTGKGLNIESLEKLKGENGCVLWRAYINAYTFLWLKSFENFQEFIKKRKLQPFLEMDENGNCVMWTDETDTKFSEMYYKKLCDKIQNYKKELDLKE